MKKTICLGIALLALMTACSNDKDNEPNPNTAPIEFSNMFVNHSTRAGVITTANLKDFSVYGFMTAPDGVVFDGQLVSRQGTGDVWTYTDTQYWSANKQYWFSAIAPGTDAAWTFTPITTAAASYNGGGTIEFDNGASGGNAQQDLLYAFANVTCTTPATQDKVALTFNHLLSRVRFSFTNTFTNDNIQLAVTDVTITDANSKGSIDMNVATPAWTIPTTSTTFSVPFGNVTGINPGAAALSTSAAFLIPADQAYTVTFKVQMYEGKGSQLAATYDHSVTLAKIDMKPGHSYEFTAALGSDNVDPDHELYPIEFTVSEVTEWANWESTNIGK